MPSSTNRMPLEVINPQKLKLLGMSAAQTEAPVTGLGWPAFRAAQLRDWVYNKCIDDVALMSNLSKADRAILHERVTIADGIVTKQQRSSDGTQKLLIAWPDGGNAET